MNKTAAALFSSDLRTRCTRLVLKWCGFFYLFSASHPFPPPPLPQTQVEQGNECGLQLGKFKEWNEGDVVECFRVEYKTRELGVSAIAAKG